MLGASPIPGLGTAGGFKFIVEDRGDLGVEDLQEQTKRVIGRLKKVPGLSRVTTQFRAKRRSFSSASTATRRPRWACRWTT